MKLQRKYGVFVLSVLYTLIVQRPASAAGDSVWINPDALLAANSSQENSMLSVEVENQNDFIYIYVNVFDPKTNSYQIVPLSSPTYKLWLEETRKQCVAQSS